MEKEISVRAYRKKDFPVSMVRRFLEPGPIVLVSSAWRGKTNLMTMGWYTVMEFEPSLVGCMITAANYSYDLIRKSGECVINLPTVDLLEQVIGVGNTTGAELDKFEYFNLTPVKAAEVKAPLVKECYANFECRVFDTRMLDEYNFFIMEVVKAHVAVSPQYPRTFHYRGDGIFMLSGEHVSRRRKFKPENL